MGVSEDWHMGYRSKSDIEEWQSKDIILNPEIVGLSKSFVEEKIKHYRNLFLELFAKLRTYPDPTIEDLYSNVY